MWPLQGVESIAEPHDDSVAAERPVHPENTDSEAVDTLAA